MKQICKLIHSKSYLAANVLISAKSLKIAQMQNANSKYMYFRQMQIAFLEYQPFPGYEKKGLVDICCICLEQSKLPEMGEIAESWVIYEECRQLLCNTRLQSIFIIFTKIFVFFTTTYLKPFSKL